MKSPYEDILHLPYSGSKLGKRMSMVERGAQFSPFAALTGYDAAIEETGRLTERESELEVDALAALDAKLRFLEQCQERHPRITLTYFVPDMRKEGGHYATVTEELEKVDVCKQMLILSNGGRISFSRIRRLRGSVFQHIEGLYFLEEWGTIEAEELNGIGE